MIDPTLLPEQQTRSCFALVVEVPEHVKNNNRKPNCAFVKTAIVFVIGKIEGARAPVALPDPTRLLTVINNMKNTHLEDW